MTRWFGFLMIAGSMIFMSPASGQAPKKAAAPCEDDSTQDALGRS